MTNDDAKSLLSDVQSVGNEPFSLYIEIDDFLGYLNAHKSVSGIQRVQSKVIEYIIGENPKIFDKYVFVLNSGGYLKEVDQSYLIEIVNYISKPYVDHKILRGMIFSTIENSSELELAENSTYLVLGAFWGYGAVASRYLYIKEIGIKIVCMIYDIIPITNSEYCDAGLPHEFTLSFADAMRIFDGFLCISEFTANDVRKYRKDNEMREAPISVVPLAHNPSSSRRSVDNWTGSISTLRHKKFVLFVSTIEARKNHLYVVNAWKQFIQEGLDAPDLIFVGRPGWHVSSLMDQLGTAQYYGGRVRILHDLSDSELATLYRNCLFTVFPSFVEGWGLPVGESLIYGKPCIASNTSAIPEVGGDFIDYIDPLNFRAGIDVIRKMTFDHDYRNERSRYIAENFVPRDWEEVARVLLSATGDVARAIIPHDDLGVLFEAGTVFEIGSLALGNSLPPDYAKSPKRLALVSGWYGIEGIGIWMERNHGTLRFLTDLPEATPVIVYLRLNCPPWADGNNIVSIDVSSGSNRGQSLKNRKKGARPGSFLMRAYGEVEKGGKLAISISVSGHAPLEIDDDPNSRQFLIGLAAIGYCSADNAEDRLKISEEFTFDA
ncbi:glycosyltransferase family 1 protein [Sphingobium sp. PAMC28499]|uniref:glycosyltransferase family 4 protein n=1 Tax=Sphingobium sp. PAMC28499 TaxID=2565554 RepID=UPI0014461FED|nr:glycosyltransferase family 1 protein [Sphingobium sp. PAMC28499]